MRGKPRSVRQAQAIHSAQLRQQGRTWAEIGAIFERTYRVNPRVALRHAHGWSQPQAAQRWNELWPDDPKTFKNFSYWEQWPGQTGHTPSLDTLDRLARLYECKITDLLGDCRDYAATAPKHPLLSARERDVGYPAAGESNGGAPATQDAQGSEMTPPTLESALELIRQAEASDSDERGGADEAGRRLRRRTLLLEASSALAVAAAAPVLEVPRAAALAASGRATTDQGVVNYTGEVVAGLRRLGGAVGPRITLQPAMALRSAMAALARNLPEIVTKQALTAYGDLTQLIGWLMFNLGDVKAARYYYDDARSAAYRAGNNDLASYTLSAASQLSAVRQKSRPAIDHAQAAMQAAKASGNPYAMAYSADVAARAYAVAGQAGRCQAALAREEEALSRITGDTPRSPWWYFYDPSFYWGTRSECALRLNMPADASEAAGRALAMTDLPLNLHNSALTLAYRAEALIKQREYEEACLALADSARLTTLNSSRRIARRVDLLRRQLRVADSLPAVRDLDDKLTEFRRAREARDPVSDPRPRWKSDRVTLLSR